MAVTYAWLHAGPGHLASSEGTEACNVTWLGRQAQLAPGIRGGLRKPFMEIDLAPGVSAQLLVGNRRRRPATDPDDQFPQSTAKLLRAMVERLRTGRTPPCSAADNINTLALMLAAYESSEAGGVRLSLDRPAPTTAAMQG